MNEKINHTRIKNFTKMLVNNCKISRGFYSEVEKFIINLVNNKISEAKEIMDLTKKRTLHYKFLRLNERFIELGERNKSFTNKEIRSLIESNFNEEIWLREGVIDGMRGYINEELTKNIQFASEALEYSKDRMLSEKHFKPYI